MRWRTLLAFVGALVFFAVKIHAQSIAISDVEALYAGKRLWKNECDGQVAGLTSWNEGENFASLGIGHYIWYPVGKRGPFEESFPDLMRYLFAQGASFPAWLHPSDPCPWNSRSEFQRDQAGARLSELRALLAKTVGFQARFSADRLQASLPKMLAESRSDQREIIRRQFARVAASPNGVYALVDYVNFKGEGILATERYQGQGWGLLQVLAGMESDPSNPPGASATQSFAKSASQVLTKRVSLAPAARGEGRWLPGWKNRVRSYAPGN